MLQSIKHRNIISSFDYFETSVSSILVLEYFAGSTMEAAVQRRVWGCGICLFYMLAGRLPWKTLPESVFVDHPALKVTGSWCQNLSEPCKSVIQPHCERFGAANFLKSSSASLEKELELEAAGSSEESMLALQEISFAAIQVSEVMSDLLSTADNMCQQLPDYISDVVFLREIGASATQITESLDAPMEKPTEEPYSDATLERAKRLAALSYELVEDSYEVEHLNNVSQTTGLVIEELERLQGESWAAGVLAEILEEEKRASMAEGAEPRIAKQIVRLRVAAENGRQSAAYDDVAVADAEVIDKAPTGPTDSSRITGPEKKDDIDKSDSDNEKEEPTSPHEEEGTTGQPKARARKRAGKKKSGAQKKREKVAREEGLDPKRQKEDTYPSQKIAMKVT
eukprot:g10319.t1